MRLFWFPRKKKQQDKQPAVPNSVGKPEADGKAAEPPKKKMPVFFIDEAHKLYELISEEGVCRNAEPSKSL